MVSQLALPANHSQGRIQNPPAAVRNAGSNGPKPCPDPDQNLDDCDIEGERSSAVRRKGVEEDFQKSDS